MNLGNSRATALWCRKK